MTESNDAEAIRRRIAHCDPAADPASTSNRPHRVAHYLIQRLLGEGGMGAVYLAHDEKLGREVALKLIKPERLCHDDARERFRREAASASRLDHVGICKVLDYDAGVATGVPYLAMQLLEGETLASRLDSAREHGPEGPTRDARAAGAPESRQKIFEIVELIEKIAEALHHAHEHRLIHRDIKPGNIFVRHDGQPVVLDFGLVREEDAGTSVLTGSWQELGTPPYMSPEQIVPRATVGIDRRADVYSLGVTLYECLTLCRPFEAQTHADLKAKIVSGACLSVSRLNRQIPSDLAVVVATAMNPERDRRYRTALLFAQDLARVRSLRPILARRPSVSLRTWRWVQRNRWVSAFVALLCVASASTSWFWWAASSNLDTANRRAVVAREALNALVFEVRDKLLLVPGEQARAVRLELLHRAIDGLAQLAATVSEDEQEGATSVAAWIEIGRLGLSIGELGPARSAFETAIGIARRRLHQGGGDFATRVVLGRALANLAIVRYDTGDAAGSRQDYVEALEIMRRVNGEQPSAEHCSVLVDVLCSFGEMLSNTGEVGRARAAAEEAVAVARAAMREQGGARVMSRLAAALIALGDVCMNRTEDSEAAQTAFDEALSVARAAGAQSEAGIALDRRFALAMARGAHREAITIAEHGLAELRVLNGRDPKNVKVAHNLSVLLEHRGSARMALQDLVGARADLEESLAISVALAQQDSSSMTAVWDVVTALHHLADVRQKQQDTSGALANLEEGIGLARKHLRTAPADLRLRRALAICLDRTGSIQLERKQYSAAVASFREQVELARATTTLDSDHPSAEKDLAVALHRLGNAHRDAGAFAASLPFFAESLEIRRRFLSRAPADVTMRKNVATESSLTGDALAGAGRAAEALQRYHEALELYQGVLSDEGRTPATRRDVASVMHKIGYVHSAAGQWRDGFRYLLDALATYGVPDEATTKDVEKLLQHVALAGNQLAAEVGKADRQLDSYEHFALAEALYSRGEEADAAEHYRHAAGLQAFHEAHGDHVYRAACAAALAADASSNEREAWQALALQWLEADSRQRTASPEELAAHRDAVRQEAAFHALRNDPRFVALTR